MQYNTSLSFPHLNRGKAVPAALGVFLEGQCRWRARQGPSQRGSSRAHATAPTLSTAGKALGTKTTGESAFGKRGPSFSPSWDLERTFQGKKTSAWCQLRSRHSESALPPLPRLTTVAASTRLPREELGLPGLPEDARPPGPTAVCRTQGADTAEVAGGWPRPHLSPASNQESSLWFMDPSSIIIQNTLQSLFCMCLKLILVIWYYTVFHKKLLYSGAG